MTPIFQKNVICLLPYISNYVICTEFGEWQAPGETPSHTDEVEGVFI
jgi:hypothetical protein